VNGITPLGHTLNIGREIYTSKPIIF